MLSHDDSKLYFVSDRLPSKGNTDIFVVDIKKDGSFSKPRNLGSFVNTEGNEKIKGEINLDNIDEKIENKEQELKKLEKALRQKHAGSICTSSN